MINKLRRKFILINMLIVTIMLIVIFGLILFFTKSKMEQESIQMLRSISMIPLQHNHPDDVPNNTVPSVFTIHKTPEGECIATGRDIIDFSDKELLSELFQTASDTGKQTGIIKEYDLRFFVQNTPMFRSVIFADISSENAMLGQLVRTCVFIAVLSFGVFFIISILLARWMVKPVETAWNEQKQFVADASHELKTPLTVIMTNAEMLLDRQHSEEKKEQFSESILTMSRQMRGLTESLLELARGDNNTMKTVFENVNLSQLVYDAVLPFEPLYYEKGLTLNCKIEDGVNVIGDSTQLCRLVDILLDNAMKYSYTQTEIMIYLKRHNNSCIYSVTNHGDTISKANLKNIFKRFYRMDKARSMNHSYGLGLAIAESIVLQHDGKIWAESTDGINTFYVKLPVKNALSYQLSRKMKKQNNESIL